MYKQVILRSLFYVQKMTAYEGYVWFMPAWFTERWWDTDSFNSQKNNSGILNENVPCSTEEMLKAIQGLSLNGQTKPSVQASLT